MAQKTKLQLQIEASEKKIQEEQKRLKQLEKKQTEKDRKDRNHRLCKRHGYLESILPDTINLTDEQFQTFVKQHIANKHGIAAIANLLGQATQSSTAATADTKPPSNTTAEVANSQAKPQSTATNTTVTTNAKPQNGNSHTPRNTTQNAINPANTQGATA